MRLPWHRKAQARVRVVPASEGGAALREAQRAVTAARSSAGQAQSLAQQMADLGHELRQLRATNHFRESFASLMREQGRG